MSAPLLGKPSEYVFPSPDGAAAKLYWGWEATFLDPLEDSRASDWQDSKQLPNPAKRRQLRLRVEC